ncbi:DUF167 domain-containing protein [Roseococcus sp. DSY-14]
MALLVRVTPGARRDAVEGRLDTPDGPALRLRVAAPPVDGAANAAVLALVARELGVRPGAVTLRGGEASRRKRLAVAGDPAALARRLAELCRGG